MKMRNKGKVYPSTSTSTTTTPVTSPAGDSLSVLNLLPAAILGLAVVLSLEDREVLAYMITRSIKSTNPTSSSFENKKNNNKSVNNNNNNTSHKSPLFECDCFDCYTSFWYKWDSSPNRELIHQAIEAFEESLTNNEQSKKKNKKKEKIGHRRLAGKPHTPAPESPSVVQVLQEYEVPFDEKVQESVEEDQDGVLGNVVEELPELLESPEMAVVVRPATAGQNKGLARKVLPDVIGLFNWRLFSLWSPNV